MEDTKILTIKEVANYLKISVAQVYRFIERDENPLPIIHISDKTKRVRMTDLQDWLSKQQNIIFDELPSQEGGEQ
jgi:excisionase family DNA binding protein